MLRSRNTHKTEVVESLDPVWDEAFNYRISGAELDHFQLRVVLVDHDPIGADDVIGEVGPSTTRLALNGHSTDTQLTPS